MSRLRLLRRAYEIAAVLGAILAAGCGSPATPSPPTAALKILCPASQIAQSLDGQPISVSYPSPIVTGGSPPMPPPACTPASGSRFPVGSTTVSCIATDAQQHSDACTFSVRVDPPPRLSATKFVAFGDSITEGKVATSIGTLIPMVELSASYTAVLRDMLNEQYPAQRPIVINEGLGGETAFQGQSRLYYQVLPQDAPQVLLLLEGVNDLNQGASIQSVVTALRAMVREGKRRGIVVFIGTLLPEGPNQSGANLIAPTDDQIRGIAASEGAVLVDLYRDFGGVTGPLIGGDGLHPTAAGHQQIAKSFLAAIRASLEVPQTTASMLFSR